MKRFLLSAVLLCAAFPSFAAQLEWFTDMEAAQAKARTENKFLLLDFTGSDWCGWCIKLKNEVFDKPEFAEFANARLVMVEVDFPHNKPQSADQKRVNEQLARVLDIKGFPTVVIVNAAGHPVGETGYIPGGPGPFIAQVERILSGKPQAPAPPPEAPEPPRKPVTFVPIAPAAPNRYDALALKAISGGKDRRMAMINNETFFVGDTAKVKVKDLRVQVVCKEIRENSVLITADGKPMELKLRPQ